MDKQIDDYIRLCKEETELMRKKAHDYANESRPLSNFHLTGMLESRSIPETILTYINTKVVRLNNLVGKGKSPKNESIEDTLRDLRIYCFLLSQGLDYERQTLVEGPSVDSSEEENRRPIYATHKI